MNFRALRIFVVDFHPPPLTRATLFDQSPSADGVR